MAPCQLICYSKEGIKKSSSDVQKITTQGGGGGESERVCLNRAELMTDYEVKIQSISVRELLNR